MSEGHVHNSETTVATAIEVGPSGDEALTLLCFQGDSERAVAYSLAQPMTAGRSDDCEIVLTDQGASRAHTRFTRMPGGVHVLDLNSRNGTFVDGKRVTQVTAQAGSLIRVGDTLIRVYCETDDECQTDPTEGPLVGGTQLAAARRLISLVGPTQLPVLLLGETGTGKEIAARMLHQTSQRSGPFIAINCAALPDSMVESELFGHEKGAFTGAVKKRKGLFAAAAGGTLFLDEVGELPAAVQAKLLRILDDKTVRSLGGETDMVVDVRILSATNRDLAREVDEDRFRADLLARLAAVELHLPPLRERCEDLPALSGYLLRRFGRPALPMTGDALEAMALYDWPRNVREFDNALRTAALSGSGQITLRQLPERIQAAWSVARKASTDPESIARRERLEGALKAEGGNVRRAAFAIGVSRGHVYALLKRWQLDPNDYRPPRSGTEVAASEKQER